MGNEKVIWRASDSPLSKELHALVISNQNYFLILTVSD